MKIEHETLEFHGQDRMSGDSGGQAGRRYSRERHGPEAASLPSRLSRAPICRGSICLAIPRVAASALRRFFHSDVPAERTTRL